MKTTTTNLVKRSPWMDWKPKARILSDSAESEPTKPSKAGCVGFDGAKSAAIPDIEAGPHPAELAGASAVLNRAGVRIMRLDGQFVIGVWSDLDGPEIRAALRTLDMDRLAIRHLDGDEIPPRYRLRRLETPLGTWRQSPAIVEGRS